MQAKVYGGHEVLERRKQAGWRAWLAEPVGTGPNKPVVPVRIGSGSGRFPTGPNSKFEFEFKK
jgi:hypothetical protein